MTMMTLSTVKKQILYLTHSANTDICLKALEVSLSNLNTREDEYFRECTKCMTVVSTFVEYL